MEKDLISQINISSLQEAEDILKGAGTEELFEKAKHQDGDMHPNGKWVWVSSANGGKGDWRTKGGRTHTKHSDSGNAGTGSTTTTQQKPITQTTGTTSKRDEENITATQPTKSTAIDKLKFETKNGFKFKKDSDYRMRYNKREKAYEIWKEGDVYGAKVAMMSIKSDDENIGKDIINYLKEKYSKGDGTISYLNTTYGFSKTTTPGMKDYAKFS